MTGAGMRHEYAWHRDMAPAEMAGADTEIVLLAIALREQVLAQQADLPQQSRRRYTQKPCAVGTSTTRSRLARRATRSRRTVAASSGIGLAPSSRG